jgi:hypothetical protein
VSGLSNTWYETINVQSGAGSALLGNASAGTSTVISKNPGGAAYLPANFFTPGAGATKGIRVTARGIFSTTATPQTLAALGVYANSTQGTSGTALGPLGAATVSIASATNWWWTYEADIVCTATGSSGTWLTMGWAQFATAVNTSTGAGTLMTHIDTTVGSTTAVTLSTESAYYLEMAATWTNASTSASSSIQCVSFCVYGIN